MLWDSVGSRWDAVVLTRLNSMHGSQNGLPITLEQNIGRKRVHHFPPLLLTAIMLVILLQESCFSLRCSCRHVSTFVVFPLTFLSLPYVPFLVTLRLFLGFRFLLLLFLCLVRHKTPAIELYNTTQIRVSAESSISRQLRFS